MQSASIKQLLDDARTVIQECEPSPGHFDFGPSYAMAVERRERVLGDLNAALAQLSRPDLCEYCGSPEDQHSATLQICPTTVGHTYKRRKA